MCSLFRLQHRFRNGDAKIKANMKKLLPRLDEKAELLPVIRIALHSTVLLLDPSWGSAWYVLSSPFVSPGFLSRMKKPSSFANHTLLQVRA